MDIRDHNRRAWDREVERGNRWTVPVTPEQIARAHSVYIRQAEEIQRCRDTLAAHVPQPPELGCDKRFFRGFPDPGWSEAVNSALAEIR